MATLYSNELKAVVVINDVAENAKNVMKEQCLTVQHFDCRCEHKRNASGEVYGPTEPVIVKFSVRMNSPIGAKAFYRNLHANADACYSFLFNATFNANQRLADYDDGMAVNGHVVSVEETFCTAGNADGESEQIQLDIRILARSIAYMGRERIFKNIFVE